MTRWVSLLRGVNVGGQRKIPMKRLAEALTAAGFGKVQTYIQSGNVLLDSPDDRSAVAATVASTIASEFGFSVSVVVRSVDELVALASAHPGELGDIDPKLLHVVFLEPGASAEGRSRLDGLADRYLPDVWSFTSSGRDMFVTYPHGSGTSRFNLDVIERNLGVIGTARNLNTVRRLIDLAGSKNPK